MWVIYYSTEDLTDTIDTFINWNISTAMKNMKEIADLWQQIEFLDILNSYWNTKTKIEILSYFYKQI